MYRKFYSFVARNVIMRSKQAGKKALSSLLACLLGGEKLNVR